MGNLIYTIFSILVVYYLLWRCKVSGHIKIISHSQLFCVNEPLFTQVHVYGDSCLEFNHSIMSYETYGENGLLWTYLLKRLFVCLFVLGFNVSLTLF